MNKSDPVSVPSRVALTACGVYTKASGHEDYTWIFDGGGMPPQVRTLGEMLSNLTSSSIVLDSEGETWVLRSFVHGIDSASRPSAAVEVSRLDEPPILSPRLWLLVAGNSIHWPARYRTDVFEADLNDPDIAAAEPGAEDEARARLGLPLAANIGVALTIVQRRPFRYAGICYAARVGGGVVPFRSELRRLLCVNFARPMSDSETLDDLRFLESSSFDREQLGILDELSGEEAQVAVRWSRTAADGRQAAAPVNPPIRWVIGELARSVQPPELFEACRSSLDVSVLRESAMAAAPDLSPEGARFLAHAATGDAVHATASVAGELAEHGYLAIVRSLPLSSWVERVTDSVAIADAAVSVLTRAGLSRGVARFFLGLEAGSFPTAAELPDVLRIVSEERLILPADRIGRALLRSGVTNDLFDQLATVAGEPFASAAAVAKSGRIPAKAMPAELLAAALLARKRFDPHEDVFLDALADLRDQERESEAHRLLAVATDALVSRETRELLEISAAGRGSVSSPLPASLSRLAIRRLLSPERVVPATRRDLIIAARAWPETSWLATLLEAHRAPETPPATVPSEWIDAVRAAIGPAVAAVLLQSAMTESRRWLCEWLAGLHDLDVAFWTALGTDEPLPPATDSKETIACWLGAMTAGFGREAKLRALAQLAACPGVWADDDAVRSIAKALAGDDERSCELGEHLLSRCGPIPPFREIPSGLLRLAIEQLPPAGVVRQLLAGEETSADVDPACIEQLAARIAATGTFPPPEGFSRRQLDRHALIADRLSAIPGWEELTLSRERRIQFALRCLARLGVSTNELLFQPIEGGGPDVQP